MFKTSCTQEVQILILQFVSFIESSFFPIPPDVMIAPMVIAKKKDLLKYF
jgi:membrane protein YqaA with SNARE-associated domain